MCVDTVLFDMGGTLEDIRYSHEAETFLLPRMAEILGMKPGDFQPDDPREFYAALTKNFAEYRSFREKTRIEAHPAIVWKDWVLKDQPVSDAAVFDRCEELSVFWETEVIERRLREEVPRMLEELKGRGLRLGVISNTGSFTQVHRSLEEYGIGRYFEEVSLSSIYGIRKPHGFIFLDTLKKMNCSASKAAYVGDTISRDVVGARNAGFHTAIQINSDFTGISDQGTVSDSEPDYIVSNLGDIPAIIDRINTK